MFPATETLAQARAGRRTDAIALLLSSVRDEDRSEGHVLVAVHFQADKLLDLPQPMFSIIPT